jgi:Domain of unknown function (DUF1707)
VQTVAVVDPGDVRTGDDDRQAVNDLLRRHTSEGRLTLDESADRAGQVFASRTRRELDEVLAGLPSELRPEPGSIADAASPGEVLVSGLTRDLTAAATARRSR